MVDITLLEVHVDDATASFSTGGSGGESDETEVVAGEEVDGEGGSGPPLGAALVGLVLVLAIALAVRKFVRGGEEPAEL